MFKKKISVNNVVLFNLSLTSHTKNFQHKAVFKLHAFVHRGRQSQQRLKCVVAALIKDGIHVYLLTVNGLTRNNACKCQQMYVGTHPTYNKYRML